MCKVYSFRLCLYYFTIVRKTTTTGYAGYISSQVQFFFHFTIIFTRKIAIVKQRNQYSYSISDLFPSAAEGSKNVQCIQALKVYKRDGHRLTSIISTKFFKTGFLTLAANHQNLTTKAVYANQSMCFSL